MGKVAAIKIKIFIEKRLMFARKIYSSKKYINLFYTKYFS